ncbi:hypothetical protein PPACK8108_LOCUS24321 [Phakopsora pachyrhizi]|uniref:Uncharacterized protein n=1 Tax=Phakopsora pachyrhizi TaxID=170000 RepID=A0AAV0BPI9_PHAPC|nr:hypothetical protein PPACK8108_LOCUS24321 [Phakopsora pachyrhizi]
MINTFAKLVLNKLLSEQFGYNFNNYRKNHNNISGQRSAVGADEEEVKEIYRINWYLVEKVKRVESKIKGLNWKVEEINKKRSREVNSLNKEEQHNT